MTSLAPLASLLLTVGQVFLALVIYACGVLIFVAAGVAKRKDREAAEEEELIRRCVEGAGLRAHRNPGRVLRGNCRVPADERWSA